MYVIKEPLADEHVMCWNCEEMVHESALQCPYCNIELRKHALQKASAASQKITPITPYPLPQAPAVQSSLQNQTDSTVAFVFSLLLFLGGSAFLFLSAMVFFFAKDGFFTISWPMSSSSAFLGLGMAAIAFGTLFLQRVSSLSDS